MIKNRSSRALFAITAAFLLLLILASCSTPSQENQTPVPEAQNKSAAPPPASVTSSPQEAAPSASPLSLEESKKYFPLEVGSESMFSYKPNPESERDVKIVYKITGKFKIAGKETFTQDIFVDGSPIRREYLNITNEGIYLVRRADIIRNRVQGSSDLNPPELIMQFPIEPGKGWQWQGKISSGKNAPEYSANFKYEQEEDVAVPAGEFKTIRLSAYISGSGNQSSNIYWYAKDVGLVKALSNPSSPTSYPSELVKSTLLVNKK